MFLLDRYLFQQFIKNFFLVLCALVSIYLLVDFFERFDNFMSADKSVELAFKYFFLKIPSMVDIIYPVCILLASVITLGILNHNHEFMALRAGGISVLRVCIPLLVCSLLFTLIALAMAEWLLPQTLNITNRIWHEEVNNRIPKGTIRQGRVYHKGINGLYSFRRPNINKDLFYDFSYAEWDPYYNISLYLTAKKALWEKGQWTFINGQIKKPFNDGSRRHNIKLFKTRQINLPESPTDFFVPEYKSNEQSLSTLFHQAKSNKIESKQAWINFNARLAFIMIGIPLVLIGMPILLTINQRWGRDLTFALPVSCGIAFAAWGWWSTAQSMAQAYEINPLIAIWSVHLLVGSLGGWLLIKHDS